jgi:myo-inositol 2-dehydrogenase / D-chiro-inositol 1-dehydrogenase
MSRCLSTRRQFFRSSAAFGASVAAVPYWFTGEKARAAETKAKNDRPQIGLIGVGGRGSTIAGEAARFGDVVAVCDVDLQHAESAKAAFGGKAQVYQDYRKLLDRKDIDVVTNGTPDHWHTAINIAACRSGRDVYAEKPLTLTIDEGKILCKVVEHSGRIVQVGTMQRSYQEFQTAVELVRNGRIGKLNQVWVALPYYTTKGGPFAKKPVPPQLDWDLYQGQAPLGDYLPQRTHANFRWWYEYAGGIITDWGNHHVDIAHWGMDCELSGPTSIEARGLFPNPQGPEFYNTPDRFFSRMLYPNGVELLYFSSINERQRFGDVGEHENTPPEKIDWLFGRDVPEEIKKYSRNGILFIGEKGKVFVNRGAVRGKAVDELKQNPLPADAWRAYPSTDHMANFFDCVKTRKQPCTPVQVEHRSITACHLTNLSIRLKRKLVWDPVKQQIVGDEEANAWQKREQRAPYLIRG